MALLVRIQKTDLIGTVLRIRNDYLSRIQIFSIPNIGHASKNFSNLTKKIVFKLLEFGNMIRVVHPVSGSQIWNLIMCPSRIPDPRIKKAPDPGSGSATLDGDPPIPNRMETRNKLQYGIASVSMPPRHSWWVFIVFEAYQRYRTQ